MKTLKLLKIWFYNGKWILSERPTKRHNWAFKTESKNLWKIFERLPYGAGIDTKIKFEIIITKDHDK